MQSAQNMQQAASLLFEGEQLEFVNMICKENHDLAMATGELRKTVDSLTHRLDQLAPVAKRRDVFGAHWHTRYFIQIFLEDQRWDAAVAAGSCAGRPKPLCDLLKALSDRTGWASCILSATHKRNARLRVGLPATHKPLCPEAALLESLTGFLDAQGDDKEPTLVLEAVIESSSAFLTEDMLLGAMEDTFADMRDRRTAMGNVYRMHGTFYLDVLLFLRQAKQACGFAYCPTQKTFDNGFPGMGLRHMSIHEAHDRMAASMEFHEDNNLDSYPDVLHHAARPYNSVELMEIEEE